MKTHDRERLVRLEIESATKAELHAIRADLAKVLAWQATVNKRARQASHLGLWLAILAGSHLASGPWGAVLQGAAKLFGPGRG